jgi:hypothetical protein
VLAGAASVLLAACGGTAVTDANAGTNTVAGVGRLPTETIPAVTFPADLSVDFTLPAIEAEPSGAKATGNRLLMIGDSLFAGVSRRYSNEACTQLVPIGWEVSVEAEPSRAVDFGAKVLDARLDEGWDVVVIELGTNYGGNEKGYFEILEGMLDDLGDRPVVLLTTTMHQPEQREVNDVIAYLAAPRDNVSVVDWEGISELPGVLSGDGVHPTPKGQVVLVAAIAQLLGAAPLPTPGACLPSEFTDDSSGRGQLPSTTRPGGTPSSPTGAGTGTTTGDTDPPDTEPSEPPPATEPPPSTNGDDGATTG